MTLNDTEGDFRVLLWLFNNEKLKYKRNVVGISFGAKNGFWRTFIEIVFKIKGWEENPEIDEV